MIRVLYDPGANHHCDLPPLKGVLENTIVQCEVCNETYVVINGEWFNNSNVDARRRIQRLIGEIPKPGEKTRKPLKPGTAEVVEDATPATKAKKKQT